MSEQESSGNSAGDAGSVAARRHVLFIWSPTGYQLAEQDGEPPSVGEEVEHGDRRYRVSKVGPSPLPGDDRICAYLQG